MSGKISLSQHDRAVSAWMHDCARFQKENKQLRARIAELESAIVENCKLCTWKQCDKCPTKKHLDRIEGGAGSEL